MWILRDPYEVLGVSPFAGDDEIKAAYRELARQYSEDGDFSATSANTKRMLELNDAYDQIILNREPKNRQRSTGSAQAGYTQSSGFADIRNKIKNGRVEDAQVLLDGMPDTARNAEWHYLKGTIFHKRGWLEQAMQCYQTAVTMEPGNAEYQSAVHNMQGNAAGGYRTARRGNKSGCSACDACSALLCADCCCECMGGDLIPCC